MTRGYLLCRFIKGETSTQQRESLIYSNPPFPESDDGNDSLGLKVFNIRLCQFFNATKHISCDISISTGVSLIYGLRCTARLNTLPFLISFFSTFAYFLCISVFLHFHRILLHAHSPPFFCSVTNPWYELETDPAVWIKTRAFVLPYGTLHT
jgi:hypothetical protein